MNILYGLYKPDEGQILLNGQPLRMNSPADAISHGIGMIHQHFMLVNSLTVTENVVLGLEGGLRGVDFAAHEKRIRELAQSVGFDIDPTAEVWTLRWECQRVGILKALYRQEDVRNPDEPTSVLAPTRSTPSSKASRHSARKIIRSCSSLTSSRR